LIKINNAQYKQATNINERRIEKTKHIKLIAASKNITINIPLTFKVPIG